MYDKTKQMKKKIKEDQTEEWIDNYRYNRDVRYSQIKTEIAICL